MIGINNKYDKITYDFLQILQKNFGQEFDITNFDYEDKYSLTEDEWYELLKILKGEGLIDNTQIHIGVDQIKCIGNPYPKITNKGLEYLKENSISKKVLNHLKKLPTLLKFIKNSLKVFIVLIW